MAENNEITILQQQNKNCTIGKNDNKIILMALYQIKNQIAKKNQNCSLQENPNTVGYCNTNEIQNCTIEEKIESKL